MTVKATRTHCPFKFGDWVEHHLIGACRFIAPARVDSSVCFLLSKQGDIEICPVHELMPHTTADTVEVRIAVAVDRDGTHAVRACYEGHSDSDTERRVAEDLRGWGGFCRVSFVTARVPLPFPPADVKGEVEPCDRPQVRRR